MKRIVDSIEAGWDIASQRPTADRPETAPEIPLRARRTPAFGGIPTVIRALLTGYDEV